MYKGIIYIFVLFLLVNCSTKKQLDNGKIKVTVSIVTYADFVKNIGGDKVEINTMIPLNSNPHDYEPIPTQITELAKSSIYFKIGTNFTFEQILLEKIKNIKNNIKIVDCSKGINIVNNNPHVWLGIDESKIICQNIFNLLKEFSPKDSIYFRNNLITYLAKIDSAEKELKVDFEKLTNKYMLVYHPAWSYFTKHYGLTEIGIEREGKEPNALDLKNVINFAKANKIRVIYVEPQFDKEVATSIAEELKAKIEVINPIPIDFLKNLNELHSKIFNSNK
ncbi:MAG: zinc ABC transporter substrate-binding protein [bacterium]